MRTSFAYGRHDCALFAAGAVAAMTGTDHARGWRGYRSRAAGLRKLREAGFEDHIALVASHLEEIHPALAAPGDVAVVEGEDGPALGIVQGESIYILQREGLGLVSLLAAQRAFRV
ncbi:hypothetical protein GL300_23225 [Paracoccus litorisediminis]|uniref:DUF6950 domain-containing protein n=2 Tax=Paracoccus litorisediminis TaxID=2006130 RepID=A0A844HUH3_9RHOB|nr:hypothetical protein [Paracoccus litorisediminis]